MDRKRQEFSPSRVSSPNTDETLAERIKFLEEELAKKEAELNVNTDERLAERIKFLEEELAKKEAELNVKNTENVNLSKQVTTLKKKLAEQEDLRQRELGEKEDCCKRITMLEHKLAEKEDQLNVSNKEKDDITRKLATLQQELMKNDAVQNNVKNDIDFPSEIVVEIFKHLTQNELGQVARVCKEWNDLSKSAILWQNVNVHFHWDHKSQNAVMKSFISRLPTCVTSMKVEFEDREKWIHPMNFQEVGMKLQKHCPILNDLILEGCKSSIPLSCIIDFCSEYLPKLRSLVLWHPKTLHNYETVQYGGCSTIEILGVIGSFNECITKVLLSKFSNLKQLYLNCTLLDDRTFEEDVCSLHQLEVLHLGSTFVGSTTFRAIKNYAKHLKELYMCWAKLGDDDLTFDSPSFPQLKTICLYRCNYVTREGVVAFVQSCPSLCNVYVNEYVALTYAEHPLIIDNPLKLSIVKTVNCNEHSKKSFLMLNIYNYA